MKSAAMLLRVVPIDPDVPSADFNADKALLKRNTEMLSEIDDSIRAVGSDACHKY
jgi:hypothetical protein